MEEVSIVEIIQSLHNKYFDLHSDMPNLTVNLIITDCLSKSHFEIRPDHKERLIEAGIENDDSFNGRMVLPFRVGDTINILLNRDNIMKYTEDGSMTWVGTYAHELTHAIDFYLMALKENLDVYDPVLEISNYQMFHLWSEYHAKKIGYNFLRIQLCVDIDPNTENDRVEYILNKEWPYHLEDYYNAYHDTDNENLQMYLTMQLLGRYSAWCDLFPKTFNEAAFNLIFINTSWMYKIFTFLRQNESFNIAYFHLEDMRLILKENWINL